MITLHNAVQLFQDSREADGLKPKTLELYRWRLNPLVESLGEEIDLNAVSPADLDNYIVQLRRRNIKHKNNPYRPPKKGKLSTATINGAIEVLKTFFKWCADRNYIPKSPADHLRKTKSRGNKLANNRAMMPKDLVKMLAYLEIVSKARNWVDVRDLAIVSFMADTLARRGEVVSLNLDSIDFNKSYQNQSGFNTYEGIVDGKVGPRPVTFSETTALYLLDWLEMRPAEALADESGDPFFVNLCRNHQIKTGKCTSCKYSNQRMNSASLWKLFNRLGKRVGIQGRVNPHSVRHLGGIIHAERVGIEITQEKLGHTDIRTTRDYYVPYNMTRVREVTNDLSLVQRQKTRDNE